jgi:hypothetical protein
MESENEPGPEPAGGTEHAAYLLIDRDESFYEELWEVRVAL